VRPLATTKNLGDRVEVRIRDNGTGISAEVTRCSIRSLPLNQQVRGPGLGYR
jgi:hypothetical protein